MSNTRKTKNLSIFSLVMLITVSIDSIRNLPLAAIFGPKLIFFFVVAAIIFLIPTGFVAAELTATHTKHSGIYGWVKHAFGEHVGFLAIWLQWINTLVWYPTTLAFIAGSITFTISPQLAHSKWILVSIIIGTFWIMTLVNLKGFHTSTKFASFCAIVGMLIPMASIIILTGYWIVSHHPVHFNITHHNIIPTLNTSQSWVSMVAIVTSFLGMELASVHVNNVPQPEKRFPIAIILSAGLILITMLVGSIAVAIVLPNQQISLVAGIMQEFHALLSASHLIWLEPIFAIMIIIGGLGSMINWIISPAQGLLQATEDHYLPQFLKKQNSNGVAYRILLIQAVLVSAAASAFLLMPNVSSSYWLLTDLSTELYVGMYVLMFLAALFLLFKHNNVSTLMRTFGGKWALVLLCMLGLLGCVITLIVGFIPPENIHIGSTSHFKTIFVKGLIIMISPCLLGYAYKKWHLYCKK